MGLVGVVLGAALITLSLFLPVADYGNLTGGNSALQQDWTNLLLVLWAGVLTFRAYRAYLGSRPSWWIYAWPAFVGISAAFDLGGQDIYPVVNGTLDTTAAAEHVAAGIGPYTAAAGAALAFAGALLLRGVLDRDTTARARQCPRCAETVKSQAKVCRFCGHDLIAAEATGGISATITPEPITATVSTSSPESAIAPEPTGTTAPDLHVGTAGRPLATCPECAETIMAAAKVCRFCGHRMTGTAPPNADSPATAAVTINPDGASPGNRRRVRTVVVAGVSGTVLLIGMVGLLTGFSTTDDSAPATRLSVTGSPSTKAADANTKADVRNTVTLVESCYVDTDHYGQCSTTPPTQLGSAVGNASVDVVPHGYVVTAQSSSGNAFMMIKSPDGYERSCTTATAGGGCTDGAW